jgi:hypothetical protein
MQITKKRPLITLQTKLENIPRQWLQDIEPRVQRAGFEDRGCWIWTGYVNSKGYPYVKIYDFEKRKETLIEVRRMVAHMFWDFLNDEVYVRTSCNVRNCVNPNHIRVTKLHYTQG